MTSEEIAELLFQRPLYEGREQSADARREDIAQLIEFGETLDAYCHRCGKDAPFRGKPIAFQLDWVKKYRQYLGLRGIVAQKEDQQTTLDFPFEIRLACTRKDHPVRFLFETSDSGMLVKLGQSPSLVDYAVGELRRFRGIASDSELREFRRGIELAAHGYNVAAFVHFRRTLERLMDDALAVVLTRQNRTEWPDYASAKMVDRIKLLADELPRTLVEHAHLYGRLSEGIHQLTEEECLEELPRLRYAIDVILEEKAQRKDAERRQAEARQLFAQGGRAQ